MLPCISKSMDQAYIRHNIINCTELVKFFNVFDNEENRAVRKPSESLKFTSCTYWTNCHTLGGGGERLFWFSNLVNERKFFLVFHQIAESNKAAVFSALCQQGITFHLVAEGVYRFTSAKLTKTYTLCSRRTAIRITTVYNRMFGVFKSVHKTVYILLSKQLLVDRISRV